MCVWRLIQESSLSARITEEMMKLCEWREREGGGGGWRREVLQSPPRFTHNLVIKCLREFVWGMFVAVWSSSGQGSVLPAAGFLTGFSQYRETVTWKNHKNQRSERKKHDQKKKKKGKNLLNSCKSVSLPLASPRKIKPLQIKIAAISWSGLPSVLFK